MARQHAVRCGFLDEALCRWLLLELRKVTLRHACGIVHKISKLESVILDRAAHWDLQHISNHTINRGIRCCGFVSHKERFAPEEIRESLQLSNSDVVGLLCCVAPEPVT